jgi:hypothetical protein
MHFLQCWLQLWNLKNNACHGKDPKATAIALRAQAQCELTQLYSFRDTVMPRKQDLFYPTVINHRMAHPSISVIRNWISTNHTI